MVPTQIGIRDHLVLSGIQRVSQLLRGPALDDRLETRGADAILGLFQGELIAVLTRELVDKTLT